jgi:dipeptidyl aminopeptidase/acylaminoacyl peptidase
MKFGLCGGLAAAFLLAATGVAAQSPKVPLTHETLWMMKRVGAPVVSPDGRLVVVSVTEPSYDPDKTTTNLWLVPADGHASPRQITGGKAGKDGVVWSPDSTRIAFSTKREGDETPQIYILNIAGGGEARRVTDISTGAFDPQWRPDGNAILFETQVWPGALDDAANAKITAEHKARKYNLRVYDHFPVRFWNTWLDGRQPTILVQPLERGAVAKDVLSGTALARESGFFGVEGDARPSLHAIWSPDGTRIVFTATTEHWNAAFAQVGYHLYSLPAEGGEASVVTPASGEYRDARFSPDGKWLYYQYAPQNAEVYNLPRLWRMTWPSGETRVLTPGFDKVVAAYGLAADGSGAWLLVPEAGLENLYRLDFASGALRPVIEVEAGGYTALDVAKASATPMLVGDYGSSVSPAEVVRIDPVARTHTNLTNFDTAEAARIDWAPPQHFWFTSAKGRRIHNMLVLPPAFDPAKRYPLLVFIHGGAASANTDQIGLRWDYHLLAAPGYVVLLTDYTGSTTFGEKFAQEIKLDPLKTPGDELNQAVDVALSRYSFIDGSRMCALGASYGGHLVYWLEATTTRFKCLVSHAGEVDLTSQWGTSDSIYEREVTNGGPPWEGNAIWRDQSPITYAAQWKTPILLSVGEHDFRVPINNTLEAWSVLQRQRVPSRLLVWPDAWHWITKPEDSRKFYEEVDAWLATYLKPGTPGG